MIDGMSLGRWFLAIALLVFGVQYIANGGYMGGLPPVAPWTPGGAAGAYIVGLLMIAAGVALAVNKRVRFVALVIGNLFLICVFVFHTWHFSAIVHNGNDRTRAFEALALGAAALVLAAKSRREDGAASGSNSQDKTLILVGRLLFASSMVIFGWQHFIYAQFVASLVTPWIPWHLFWVYLTGVGMIVAGLTFATGVLVRLSGWGLGLMFFLWVLLLHAPRVLAALHNADERNSLFVALAFAGASLVMGEALSRRPQSAQT